MGGRSILLPEIINSELFALVSNLQYLTLVVFSSKIKVKSALQSNFKFDN